MTEVAGACTIVLVVTSSVIPEVDITLTPSGGALCRIDIVEGIVIGPPESPHESENIEINKDRTVASVCCFYCKNVAKILSKTF